MQHSVLGKVMQEESEEEAASSSSSSDDDDDDGQAAQQQNGKAARQQPGEQGRSDDPSKQPEASTSAPSSVISNTVFVRGLALDTTSIELQLKMESYGPVQSCRCARQGCLHFAPLMPRCCCTRWQLLHPAAGSRAAAAGAAARGAGRPSCRRKPRRLHRPPAHPAWPRLITTLRPSPSPPRLVIDKMTGKPKGTAFVEFKAAASAERAAAACTKARKGQGADVTVKGRVLDVDLAVDQNQARALSAQLATDKAGECAGAGPGWGAVAQGLPWRLRCAATCSAAATAPSLRGGRAPGSTRA